MSTSTRPGSSAPALQKSSAVRMSKSLIEAKETKDTKATSVGGTKPSGTGGHDHPGSPSVRAVSSATASVRPTEKRSSTTSRPNTTAVGADNQRLMTKSSHCPKFVASHENAKTRTQTAKHQDNPPDSKKAIRHLRQSSSRSGVQAPSGKMRANPLSASPSQTSKNLDERAPKGNKTSAVLKGKVHLDGNAKLPKEKTERVSPGSRPSNVKKSGPKPTAAFLEAHKLKKSSDDALFHLETNATDVDTGQNAVLIKAKKTGQLNLAGRNLTSVPEKLWCIHELDTKERQKLSLDKVDEGDPWWDFVDLTKLILANNSISIIPSEIGQLVTLNILDLHDNAIEILPPEIGQLENLSKLNLSHNKLRRLPHAFFNLRSLLSLDLANNQLISLSDQISQLDMLERLDLSHNQVKSVPNSIGYLVRLTFLNLSNNKLVELPPDVSFMRELKTLDLTQNLLQALPESLGDMHKIECLYVRQNSLNGMPNLRSCNHLKELHLGNNKISEVTIDNIENIPNISILDLRDNKIPLIPDEIVKLQSLERLDLTNNDLSNLPYTLGMMPNLKSLLVEGNSLKAIRRDIIQRGTIGLLKYLKSRLTDEELQGLQNQGNVSPVASSHSPPKFPDKFVMKSLQAMNLAQKELTMLPEETVKGALEAEVSVVDLSKNSFSQIPEALVELMPSLHDLNMSHNHLESPLPGWLGLKAVNLQYLNLANNRLTQLPNEMSSLPQLREIVLAHNRFESIPSCLFSCSKLENLVMPCNKIVFVDVSGLAMLKSLAVLDLQNNSIEVLPPELGEMRQLKHLQLEGNAFRVPRPQILMKGTDAILAYLRDRIPR